MARITRRKLNRSSREIAKENQKKREARAKKESIRSTGRSGSSNNNSNNRTTPKVNKEQLYDAQGRPLSKYATTGGLTKAQLQSRGIQPKENPQQEKRTATVSQPLRASNSNAQPQPASEIRAVRSSVLRTSNYDTLVSNVVATDLDREVAKNNMNKNKPRGGIAPERIDKQAERIRDRQTFSNNYRETVRDRLVYGRFLDANPDDGKGVRTAKSVGNVLTAFTVELPATVVDLSLVPAKADLNLGAAVLGDRNQRQAVRDSAPEQFDAAMRSISPMDETGFNPEGTVNLVLAGGGAAVGAAGSLRAGVARNPYAGAYGNAKVTVKGQQATGGLPKGYTAVEFTQRSPTIRGAIGDSANTRVVTQADGASFRITREPSSGRQWIETQRPEMPKGRLDIYKDGQLVKTKDVPKRPTEPTPASRPVDTYINPNEVTLVSSDGSIRAMQTAQVVQDINLNLGRGNRIDGRVPINVIEDVNIKTNPYRATTNQRYSGSVELPITTPEVRAAASLVDTGVNAVRGAKQNLDGMGKRGSASLPRFDRTGENFAGTLPKPDDVFKPIETNIPRSPPARVPVPKPRRPPSRVRVVEPIEGGIKPLVPPFSQPIVEPVSNINPTIKPVNDIVNPIDDGALPNVDPIGEQVPLPGTDPIPDIPADTFIQNFFQPSVTPFRGTPGQIRTPPSTLFPVVPVLPPVIPDGGLYEQGKKKKKKKRKKARSKSLFQDSFGGDVWEQSELGTERTGILLRGL